MSCRLFLPLWLALSTLPGCNGSAVEPAGAPEAKAYFDLKGFLDQQRSYLESVSPPVVKTAQAGDQPAESHRLARVNWEKELAFFYEADLNKPALQGLYETTRAMLPAGGERVTYTRRPDESSAIRELIIEMAPSGVVRLIRAEQDEQNMLFASGRTLTLRCDPAPAHNRLLEYTVAGRQKLILFDETRYQVRGDIE